MALSENASMTRYTIKIELKLKKWVPEKKSYQLSFERREWAGWSDDGDDDEIYQSIILPTRDAFILRIPMDRTGSMGISWKWEPLS